MAFQDAPNDVATVAEPHAVSASPAVPTTSATPEPPDEAPAHSLYQLTDNQRESFVLPWNTVPPHIRRRYFLLDATGWDFTATDVHTHGLCGRFFFVKIGPREMFSESLRDQRSPGDTVDSIPSIPTEIHPL